MNPADNPTENRCSHCNEPAVIRLAGPERRLCSEHFIEDTEKRVLAVIEHERMVVPGDRIAVGLSGGKDSTALLLLLHRFLSGSADVSLVAVTIDEGIAGYREETVAAAGDLTDRLGVEHRIIPFGDLFGNNLDTILAGRERQACSICGVLRRRALNKISGQVGATKIATGHNLDDMAQSVLMNVLRGDLPPLLQDTSSGYPGYFLPRIKPLSVLSEKEITTYLLVRGFYRDLPGCPYAGTALRGEIGSMLAVLEQRHPGTKEHLIRFLEGVRRFCPAKPKGALHICHLCGELSSGEICQVCRMLGREE